MNSFNRKVLGIGMAAVMLASGAAVPASAAEVQSQTAVSASVKQVGALAKPKIVKTVKGQAAVKLRWKKIARASGYKVFMKTASGWKCKGVVKGVNNVTYKVQGLNSKTKYQFKVQAYKKSKGKTYYSKYSAPVTVETKYGLGKNNFTSKEFSIGFSSKYWTAGSMGDLFTLEYKGDDTLPAQSLGLMIVGSPHDENTKGKTIEEYMDELMKPFEDDDSVAFIGYTEIDGVKFGIVDEYRKKSDDIPYDSTIRTCIGFTKKNVFTVIEGYPTDLKTPALKKLNNTLKKADFK